MNDKQAADRLDAHITNAQHKQQTGEDFPFVDQLLTLAESIDAGPTLQEKVHKSMNTKMFNRQPLRRWAGVAAAVALVVLMFVTLPALRGVAAGLLDIFAVQDTDLNPAAAPTAPPPAGVSPQNFDAPEAAAVNLTLQEVQDQVAASSVITFDITAPASVPAGFSYDAGFVDEFGRMVLLIYASDDRLSLFQIRLYDLANPNPAVEVRPPLGASADVEDLTIDGYPAQYAQGDYGANDMWDADAPARTLAWQTDNMLIIITTYEQGTKLSRADLIAIAESLLE